MRFLILLLLLTSCYKGLNFNVGISHNDYMSNRSKIVEKQDKYSKKQMSRQRKSSTRAIKKAKKVKMSNRRLIR